MFKRIWAFLGSIRFVIPLLIVITLVSLVGIVIPQGQTESFYATRLGPGRAAVISAAGLDHVFSTQWFYALLALLSVNILVCSGTRLRQNVARVASPQFLADPDAIKKMREFTSFHAPGTPAEVVRAAAGYFRSRLHLTHVQGASENGGAQLNAQSGLIKDIGSFLFHLGLVVLFIGGLWGRMGGYTYVDQISPGESVAVRDMPFRLQCNWFRLDLNEKGQIAAYRSDLSVISSADSSVLMRKEIRVNDPLTFGPVRFYQSSYGESGTAMEECIVAVRGPGADVVEERVLLRTGVPVRLAQDTSIELIATRFVSDFMIDLQTRAVTSRSSRGENPALRIVAARGTDTLLQRWVFARMDENHGGADSPLKVRFLDYKPAYYTGIQIVKNPGVGIIWVGLVVMTIGILLLFYISRRTIWIYAVPAGTGSAVMLGGMSNRPAELFADEFKKIGDRIRRHLG